MSRPDVLKYLTVSCVSQGRGKVVDKLTYAKESETKINVGNRQFI